ncbi:MAG: AraD1 family protein [Balneolaceae bacterium]
MELLQCLLENGERRLGIIEGDQIREVDVIDSVYDLFFHADAEGVDMESAAYALTTERLHSFERLLKENRVLVPFGHPDPYHTWITGTGLTHLGSAESRDAMHKKVKSENEEKQTDSMKIFRMGLENGKMKGGQPASQPEWFYKGNGLMAVPPGGEIPLPSFAMDGGEEPEIAGLYIVDDTGEPRRIGFALANEFSDHKMEKVNYLYLAHSKLRHCSYGPTIRLGELPGHVTGRSRILREGKLLWEKEFLTGEQNMSHNLANLEHHHFKYDLFRQPGDAHVHFFGTSALSFTDGIETEDGDLFEIEADCFQFPLKNRLKEVVF